MLGTRRHLRNTGNTREGFTLIELLVVIAVIAILASILFPVFSQARERARRTSCLSNLKQIGLACQQYTQDYDEKLVPGYMDNNPANDPAAWWFTKLDSYTRNSQIFKCPSSSAGANPHYTIVMLGYRADSTAIPPCSVLNWNGGGNKVVSLAQAARPAESAMIIENGYCDSHDCSGSVVTGASLSAGGYFDPTTYNWKSNYPGRHQDGQNVLYVDGHAKWKKTYGFRGRDLYLNESAETGWTGW